MRPRVYTGRYSGPARVTDPDGGYVDTASLFFQADLKSSFYPHVASSLKHGHGHAASHKHSLKHKLMRGDALVSAPVMKLEAVGEDGRTQRVVFGYDQWTGNPATFAGQNLLVAVENEVAV